MITVWFIVQFMFASDARGIAPHAEVPKQVEASKENTPDDKPALSQFQNWGPAFETQEACTTWAASHVKLSQGMRAGCASVQVAEVGK